MLEQETEAILKSLVMRTIGERDAISLKEVVAANIPKGIKAYVQAEVEQGLNAELLASDKFSRVGGNSSTGVHLMKTFLGTLALEYVFPRTEFLTILDNAVHFLENYLCRPHWTLEHFLFEDAEHVSRDALLKKLRYFSDYSYLIILLERLISQKGRQDITLGDFRALLVIIDDQIVKQHSPKELAILAKPIFEFLLLTDISSHSSISIKPLLVFYEDKNMRVLKLYLERICQIRAKTEISMTELAGIIEDLYTDGFGKSEQREPAPRHADAPPPPQPIVEVAPELPFGDSPADRQPVAPQKPMTFKQAAPDAPTMYAGLQPVRDVPDVPAPTHAEEPEEPAPTAPPADEDAHDGSGEPHEDENAEPSPEIVDEGKRNIPLSLTFAGMKLEQPQPPPDLNAIISKDQRELFIRKLFKKNEALYADIIAELNTAPNWKEASLFLNELFETSKLDPFTDVAIQFTDVVQQRYTIGPTRAS